MKHSPIQTKKIFINRLKQLITGCHKQRGFPYLFFTISESYFEKKDLNKNKNFKKEKINKEKNTFLLLIQLLIVFILLIEQILIKIFWVFCKNELKNKHRSLKTKRFFITAPPLILLPIKNLTNTAK